MKHLKKLFVFVLVGLMATGCGSNDSSSTRVNSGSTTVDQVISAQIEEAETESEAVRTAEADGADIQETNAAAKDTAAENAAADTSGEKTQTASTQKSGEVDIDLTSMNSDMVYAVVYQMMVNPDAYIGKTIRMGGTYYAAYYEPTAQYYHYCFIQDAASCCAQSLEFVWGDGSRVYPDEYPTENSVIVVEGTFETYEEEGYLYCRLGDAKLSL